MEFPIWNLGLWKVSTNLFNPIFKTIFPTLLFLSILKKLISVLDASEKVQSGYLTGNIRQTGNYDECMAVRSNQNDSYIQGKYCLYGISSNMTDRKSIFNVKKQLTLRGIKVDHIEDYLNGIKATSAVCVPLSCSGEDLQLIWNYTEYYFDAKLHFIFDEKYCDYEGRVHFEKMDILAMYVVSKNYFYKFFSNFCYIFQTLLWFCRINNNIQHNVRPNSLQ